MNMFGEIKDGNKFTLDIFQTYDESNI
jgi:hypothetical protein